jgi:hypothetical protein
LVDKDPQQMFRLDDFNAGSYFSVPLNFNPGVLGKRHPNCNRLLNNRLDTAGGRRYDAANLYIVLDRIVKPHI